ncbi:O-antigen ligase family protein [Aliiglaciecola sp. 2_MG-2023]|uniref:O-antigen ligase family protein n=1 Tax=unclassified Aliiglaciecola TaxID=2593648 RepID=UPI0026E23DD0|nr:MULTISPECIES: O-antigen ligase family protein [unclassified Aliiglaciecola]MDO6712195.1 O-antigen ligase family protein [Aliiglaciecola sp. 2_MG-2023]MDO6753567.1 O-antigen ligase family protein [Aliiglaciecola sp. 1_MG-2023]
MQIMTYILTIGCIATSWKKPWLGLHQYRVPIILWLIFLVISIIQIIPLPSSLLHFLSPQAYAIQLSGETSNFYLSLDLSQSKIALLKSFNYFCLFVVMLTLVNDNKRIRFVLLTILISATFQALYGTLELLSGLKYSLIFSLPVSDSVTGSFVYKNHYANYLMLGLSAGIGLMVASLQTEKPSTPRDFLRSVITTLLGNKALIRISLAIIVIALVMSKSRMGNVAFFCSMTICGIMALILIKNKSRSLSILIVSMFIIDVFILSAWFGLDKIQDRLVNTSLTQESRDEVLLDSLPIISHFPLFGSGAGSYYAVFPQYKVNEVHNFYDHAHNDYLQMTIEYGVPATSLLALLAILSLYNAFYAMHHRKKSNMKGAAFASAMAIIGMLIHMTVDFPLQAPTNASYFVIFLAIAWIVKFLKMTNYSAREIA